MAALSPSAPPAPVNPTGQIAQQLPSYDPGPVIAAQEQSLQDFLNLPVKEILARLGLPPLENAKPEDKPGEEEKQPPEEPPPASPMDPSALISPVTDALGTLGSGLFEGVDPTQMLAGISNAFGSTGPQLQQSLTAVDDAWQGAGGTAAAAKTATAIANGSEVAAQSDGLRSNLEAAAANVAQARVRMIEIITEFVATLAAIGPNIIFPWGWAAAIAAANKAIASAAEVMTELQNSLATQAAETMAVGEPVKVTDMPQMSAPATSSAGQPASGMASQLMSMAMKGAQAGIQAGTGAASSASEAAKQTTDPAFAPVGAGAAGLPPPGSGGGSGGGGVGGGAGGPAPPRSIATSAMVQPETSLASNQSTAMRTSGGGTAGPGMMGAPYAPMAGAAHGANSSSNGHTAAAFLHTTDQGGEIVGDLGTAAPPVLGEADPNEPPDIELRI